jgi:hypothetical protein
VEKKELSGFYDSKWQAGVVAEWGQGDSLPFAVRSGDDEGPVLHRHSRLKTLLFAAGGGNCQTTLRSSPENGGADAFARAGEMLQCFENVQIDTDLRFLEEIVVKSLECFDADADGEGDLAVGKTNARHSAQEGAFLGFDDFESVLHGDMVGVREAGGCLENEIGPLETMR